MHPVLNDLTQSLLSFLISFEEDKGREEYTLPSFCQNQ